MKKLLFALVVVLGLASSLVAKEYTCTQFAVYNFAKNTIKKVDPSKANVFKVGFENNEIHYKMENHDLTGYKIMDLVQNNERVELYKDSPSSVILMMFGWNPNKKILSVGYVGTYQVYLYRCE